MKSENFITLLRGYAIISVIIAHVNVYPNNNLLAILFDKIGLLGVIIFFILSGFLFEKNKDSFKLFWKKKLKTIIIPWIFCSIVVFFISFLFGSQTKSLSVKTLINFIIGNGSLFYFMTCLIVLYLIFTVFKRIKNNTYVLIIISIIIYTLTLIGEFQNINPHLNIFNWSMFFCTGILFSRNELTQKYIKFSEKYFIWNVIFFVFLSWIDSEVGSGYTYFRTFSLFIEFFGVSIIVFFACWMKYQNFILIELGRYSFTIYLVHMPIASLINRLFMSYSSSIFVLVKSILVLLICYLNIRIIVYLSCKFRILNRFKIFIGLRD